MADTDEFKHLDTIPKRLDYASKHLPEKELFVFCSKGKRISYTAKSLLRLAGKFAARLQRKGFKSGDVIANTLPNSPERLITDLGITLAGCIAMNGQILLSDGSDLQRSAWQARCRAVIVCPEERSSAWRLLKRFVDAENNDGIFCPITFGKAEDLTTAVLVWPQSSERSLLAELDIGKDVPVLEMCAPNDVLYIFTTSGSTGYSKLVHRTHAEEIVTALTFYNTISKASSNEERISYNERPLGWAGGFPRLQYVKWETSVLHDELALEDFDADELVSALLREKCTWSFMSSSAIAAIAKSSVAMELSTPVLDVILVGGQPTTRSQAKSAYRVASKVVIIYGSTECGLLTSETIQPKDLDDFQDYCCGTAVANAVVRVADDKTGVECAPGTVGNICIKAVPSFAGYFSRQKDSTPESPVSKDGWLQLGDYGFIGQDGKLYVMGRTNDVIMYGGAVLYPGWLEAQIKTHPDLSEAVIVPVSDPILHHNICAAVQLKNGRKLTEKQLDEFCRQLFVSDISNEFTPVPKFFLIHTESEMPLTLTGKPDKVLLRKRAEELFGCGEKR